MTTRRGHPAYSLEIVVSDDQFAWTGQIIADAPGHVDVREAGPKTSGWVRDWSSPRTASTNWRTWNPGCERPSASTSSTARTGSWHTAEPVARLDGPSLLAAAYALASLTQPASATRLLPQSSIPALSRR